ncbi:MAG TPA: class I SAM-dependent methyltransferase [Chloroflexia bacterium]|nr:class I SAM-dependent methyltransferase [Chloroflexia bacterium]
MKLLSDVLVPRYIDKAMSQALFTVYRQQVVSQAEGVVLEIGFGSGLNLPHYLAEKVRQLTTVDPSPGGNKLAQPRIKASPIPVEQHLLSAEKLPFPNNSFDTVVSTWTLCGLPKLDEALDEIKRVVKPGGTFLFLEHGLNNNPQTQKWQQRLDPLHCRLPGGCHLNRDIAAYITGHLQILELNQFVDPKLGKLTGYLYQGKATKNS